MIRTTRKQSGFSTVEIVLAILVIGAIAAAGLLIYQRYRSTATTNPIQTTNHQQTTTTTQPPADPYAGWKTFTDNTSAHSTGISIKYPSDWQVNTASTKTYAWSIAQTTNSNNVITVLDVSDDGTKTARQVWESCYTTDVCSGSVGDKILTGSESTVNGLNAYMATMQTSNDHTFYVTVIRANKATSPASTPFVIFTIYTTDQTALGIFDKIMASATFPN